VKPLILNERKVSVETLRCFPRQRERPTSTNPQLFDSNKNLVVSPTWVLYSKTGRLTVGRNIRLRLNSRERLKLGGGQAYDRSSDYTAVVDELIKIGHDLLY
jgi:hypothetical protein